MSSLKTFIFVVKVFNDLFYPMAFQYEDTYVIPTFDKAYFELSEYCHLTTSTNIRGFSCIGKNQSDFKELNIDFDRPVLAGFLMNQIV